MTQIQKKSGLRRMKWMIAITRSAIAHHENAKKRNDPIVKTHYSTQPNKREITNAHHSIPLVQNKRRPDRGRPNIVRNTIYFGVAGGTGVALVAGAAAAAGPDTRSDFVTDGNLSAFAHSRLTCHI